MSNILKYFILSITTMTLLILSGCNDVGDTEKYNVEFDELLRNQSKYFGRNIVVKGYLKKDFGVDRYPTIGYSLLEGLDEDLALNSISLIFESDQEALKAANLQSNYVEVNGISTGLRGDMSIDSADIKMAVKSQ